MSPYPVQFDLWKLDVPLRIPEYQCHRLVSGDRRPVLCDPHVEYVRAHLARNDPDRQLASRRLCGE